MYLLSPNELINFQTEEIKIPSDNITLSGTLLLPDGKGKFPCVILAGGTMSHTRDGELVDPGREVPRRDALKRMAEKLAVAGYASIRWDKRGYGGTPSGPHPTTNEDETADLIAVIRFARRHPKVLKVIVAGESAGAYFACLAAKAGVQVDAYVFLGALCSNIENLYAYNYGRLKNYAEQSVENYKWAEQTAPFGLALGKHYLEMIKAARSGDEVYIIEHGDQSWEIPLARMRKEIIDPPGEQFRYISVPALVLHGEQDMNVPPEDAVNAERVMKEAGNRHVTRIMIPHADHSFQVAGPDAETRMRERHSFASFARPYHEDVYTALINWLRRTIPTPINGAEIMMLRQVYSLSRPGILAWEGIKVINDVTDVEMNPGVETLEGRIGPLMKGDKSQVHYIEMPAGLFLAEHPHPSESLIYTVRGRWVLCSGGIRHLMKPGSLFWFGVGISTGYEVPFDEPAFILIFKGQRSEDSDEVFLEYLHGLAERLEKEQVEGTPFRLDNLPPDHPARAFARRVNPERYTGDNNW